MDNVPHCKMIEDMRNEAVKEAAKLNSYQIALNLIALGTLSDEEIAKATELSLKEVNELKAQASPVNA